ncbi:site-2 protease family protein, partial [Patescibacteria group bacterium]|nr:site-2 protease family protein [Patescibacteria group bacterium]
VIEFALLAAIVVSVNLSLGIFNLLPIPPLDGYTVLRGLLPYKMSMAFREFEERILQGGIFSLILILFLFSYFLSAPFGALIRTVFKFLVGA